jgi:hypothetical protein
MHIDIFYSTLMTFFHCARELHYNLLQIMIIQLIVRLLKVDHIYRMHIEMLSQTSNRNRKSVKELHMKHRDEFCDWYWDYVRKL